jgi:hypothetical protein
MDVMLHLPDMISLPHEGRRRVIIQKLEREIPEVLTQYDFANFDQTRFEGDLRTWFSAVAA